MRQVSGQTVMQSALKLKDFLSEGEIPRRQSSLMESYQSAETPSDIKSEKKPKNTKQKSLLSAKTRKEIDNLQALIEKEEFDQYSEFQ